MTAERRSRFPAKDGIFPYLGFQGQNRVPIRWRGERDSPRFSRMLIHPRERSASIQEPSNKARL